MAEGGKIRREPEGDGFRKPCSGYPGCKHAKHGYTRKDRPAPR